MNGSNNFEKKLAEDVGWLKAMIEGVMPAIERALNNQEEAFRRLNKIEVNVGKQETKIKTVFKDLDGMKKTAGKLSLIISTVLTVALNLARMIFWKDQ